MLMKILYVFVAMSLLGHFVQWVREDEGTLELFISLMFGAGWLYFMVKISGFIF